MTRCSGRGRLGRGAARGWRPALLGSLGSDCVVWVGRGGARLPHNEGRRHEHLDEHPPRQRAVGRGLDGAFYILSERGVCVCVQCVCNSTPGCRAYRKSVYIKKTEEREEREHIRTLFVTRKRRSDTPTADTAGTKKERSYRLPLAASDSRSPRGRAGTARPHAVCRLRA